MSGAIMGAQAYGVELLAREDWGIWERLLARCPQANPFSRPDWLEPLAALTGARVEITVCRKGEEPVAGFAALCRQGALGITARLAPATPYNTVAILPRSCREPHRCERFELDVLRAIRQFACQRYDYVRFVHHPALRDVRAFEWDEWRTAVFYTHRLRLAGGRDPLEPVSADVRRRAQHAGHCGVRVALEPDVGDFYSLLARPQVWRRQQIPLPQKGCFHLCRYLVQQGAAEVRLARSPGGEPLAGNLVIRDAGTAYLWILAADPAHFETGANQLLMLETIRGLSGEVDCFDLCGAFHPSVAQFKSSLGGELTPYYTVWRASGRRARCAIAARDLLLGLGLRRGGYW